MFIKIEGGYLNLDKVNFIKQDEVNKNILIFHIHNDTIYDYERKKIFKTESDLLSFLIYLAQNQFDKLQGF